jgi:hypothetical protein
MGALEAEVERLRVAVDAVVPADDFPAASEAGGLRFWSGYRPGDLGHRSLRPGLGPSQPASDRRLAARNQRRSEPGTDDLRPTRFGSCTLGWAPVATTSSLQSEGGKLPRWPSLRGGERLPEWNSLILAVPAFVSLDFVLAR